MALQTFTAAQVLTAAQMNALQANDYNQTVSTKTASYTLVAADKGTRIVMNSASATTITVNTSLFSAGDTLILQNISTGVCTVTAGTATVSSAGSLAIPQNGSGILYFTSAGVSIYYPSAVTASASGLNLISTTTIGTTVSSVTISNAFSATYDNYRIIISGGAASTSNLLRLNYGADVTNYYWATNANAWTQAAVYAGGANVAFAVVGSGETNGLNGTFDVIQPFTNVKTTTVGAYSVMATGGAQTSSGSFHNSASSFSAFTITPSTGTLTGGTIKIYGYSNS